LKMNLYKGSCHCEKVSFQIKAKNVMDELYRCNCSLCMKKSIIMKFVDKHDFSLLEGEEFLSSYKWNKNIAEHFFCKVCGIYTHHKRRKDPNQISVNIACIENISLPAENIIGTVDGASSD